MIGVAEVVVYAGYLKRVKEAKEKGKKEVETKEIVKTWIIGGNENKEKSNALVSIEPDGPQKSEVRRRRPPG